MLDIAKTIFINQSEIFPIYFSHLKAWSEQNILSPRVKSLSQWPVDNVGMPRYVISSLPRVICSWNGSVQQTVDTIVPQRNNKFNIDLIFHLNSIFSVEQRSK